jgi:hypothetical protein
VLLDLSLLDEVYDVANIFLIAHLSIHTISNNGWLISAIYWLCLFCIVVFCSSHKFKLQVTGWNHSKNSHDPDESIKITHNIPLPNYDRINQKKDILVYKFMRVLEINDWLIYEIVSIKTVLSLLILILV